MDGNISTGTGKRGTKRTEANLTKALLWARQAIATVINLLAILQNTVASLNAAGAVVVGGAPLSPTVVLGGTKSGKIRASVWASYQIPTPGAGSNTVTPVGLLTVTPPIGPITVTKLFAPATTVSDLVGDPPRTVDFGATQDIIAPGWVPGATIALSWTTTAADTTVTLGNGVTGFAAGITLEERP